MKAIIIAAGQGQRLRPHTAQRPKCMVEVNGKSLIERQVETYRAAGIDEIVIIRGYRGRQIQIPGVRYVDNVDFKENNILESLFCARDELVGDVVISYGDITFHPEILNALVTKHSPSMVVVDLDWKQVYEGRDDHPTDQAELCVVEELTYDGSFNGTNIVHRVIELGKHVTEDNGVGEFIGLARFTAAAVARLCALYDRARLSGPDSPYQHANSLQKAYFTDLLNDAINKGEFIRPFWIKGGWREIDTVQDYDRAQEEVNW